VGYWLSRRAGGWRTDVPVHKSHFRPWLILILYRYKDCGGNEVNALSLVTYGKLAWGHRTPPLVELEDTLSEVESRWAGDAGPVISWPAIVMCPCSFIAKCRPITKIEDLMCLLQSFLWHPTENGLMTSRYITTLH